MQHTQASVVLLLLLLLLPPTRSASHNCSEFQAAVARDAFSAAANSDACADFVTATGGALWINWPCDDDACAFTMRDTAPGLPDCGVDGVNLRSNVSDAIARCSSAPAPPSNASSSSGSSSSRSPAASGRQSDRSPAIAQLVSLILVVGLSFYL